MLALIWPIIHFKLCHEDPVSLIQQAFNTPTTCLILCLVSGIQISVIWRRKVHARKEPSVRNRQENQGLSHLCLQTREMRCVQKQGMPNPACTVSSGNHNMVSEAGVKHTCEDVRKEMRWK